MNIKSLLLGSAAALAAVSGAQAADAIVAAAPEPVEYVRVCDAFGKGYFYIPGTETCLKISGYVRFQADWSSFNRGPGIKDFDWDARTRGLVTFNAKSDTELGALGSTITIRTWANGDGTQNSLDLDEAFLTLGGFRAGYGYNYWDAGLSGETDDLGSNRINQIGYEYTAGSIKAGLFVDELTKAYSRSAAVFNAGTYGTGGMGDNVSKNVGIEGQISGVFGPVNVALLGGYDIAAEEGAVRLMGTAAIGPGTLGAAVVYSSGVNAYYDKAEWTTAVEYAVKVTDKLTLTPGFQYWWNVNVNAAGDYTNGDAWKAGLTVDYAITSGLTGKVSVQYSESDAAGVADKWEGYFRLQRTF
ncbi:porin [Rhizobium oryzicola]|uniref:Porin n=1 Tax=Rhizobium oryzicola TaxID=1232668 RepID=A0ABT8STM3_9HYPH|nr:porin [Rhizobium oryzicola]MDO1581615.1 porin [Rhizobium oryzicola]